MACNQLCRRCGGSKQPGRGRVYCESCCAPTQEKPCGVCGDTKPRSEFYAHASARDGLRGECKACFSAKTQARLNDPVARERKAVRDRARYWRDPERHREAARKWREANPERMAELNRQHYAANREQRLEQIAAYRAANPDRAREWDAARAARRRARYREQFVEAIDPQAVYGRDGGRCGICNQHVNAGEFHVDHIVPLSRGGEHSYANVQIAHPFCNRSKGARLPEEMACPA